MKITLNIEDWDAAIVSGKKGSWFNIADGTQLDIEKNCNEVQLKLTKVEAHDQPMSASTKSNVGGTLSFHNDG